MKIKNSIKKKHIKKYIYDFIAQVAIFAILTQTITQEAPGIVDEEVVNWGLLVPVMVLVVLANIFIRKSLS